MGGPLTAADTQQKMMSQNNSHVTSFSVPFANYHYCQPVLPRVLERSASTVPFTGHGGSLAPAPASLALLPRQQQHSNSMSHMQYGGMTLPTDGLGHSNFDSHMNTQQYSIMAAKDPPHHYMNGGAVACRHPQGSLQWVNEHAQQQQQQFSATKKFELQSGSPHILIFPPGQSCGTVHWTTSPIDGARMMSSPMNATSRGVNDYTATSCAYYPGNNFNVPSNVTFANLNDYNIAPNGTYANANNYNMPSNPTYANANNYNLPSNPTYANANNYNMTSNDISTSYPAHHAAGENLSIYPTPSNANPGFNGNGINPHYIEDRSVANLDANPIQNGTYGHRGEVYVPTDSKPCNAENIPCGMYGAFPESEVPLYISPVTHYNEGNGHDDGAASTAESENGGDIAQPPKKKWGGFCGRREEDDTMSHDGKRLVSAQREKSGPLPDEDNHVQDVFQITRPEHPYYPPANQATFYRGPPAAVYPPKGKKACC